MRSSCRLGMSRCALRTRRASPATATRVPASPLVCDCFCSLPPQPPPPLPSTDRPTDRANATEPRPRATTPTSAASISAVAVAVASDADFRPTPLRRRSDCRRRLRRHRAAAADDRPTDGASAAARPNRNLARPPPLPPPSSSPPPSPSPPSPIFALDAPPTPHSVRSDAPDASRPPSVPPPRRRRPTDGARAAMRPNRDLAATRDHPPPASAASVFAAPSGRPVRSLSRRPPIRPPPIVSPRPTRLRRPSDAPDASRPPSQLIKCFDRIFYIPIYDAARRRRVVLGCRRAALVSGASPLAGSGRLVELPTPSPWVRPSWP